jgi:N-formylglutamate amidohydrolase
MNADTLILKRPRRGLDPLPILVSIPHYGTEALPQIGDGDYSEPWFRTFAYGFADTFAGDLYSDLYQHGVTVLATPISRIFVDLNRRRADFQQENGIVRSTRGVVRTHTIRDVPIFTHDLSHDELEERLVQFYDPYYATIDQVLQQIRATHGYALLLDAHTGSPRRMLDYQVIIGTRHGVTSHDAIGDSIDAIFTKHGFEVHHNISGYAGGNIVRTYGQPETENVHAIQLEINASLLMTTSRQEFLAHISRGEVPSKNHENIARLRLCLQEVIAALPDVLLSLHTET